MRVMSLKNRTAGLLGVIAVSYTVQTEETGRQTMEGDTVPITVEFLKRDQVVDGRIA